MLLNLFSQETQSPGAFGSDHVSRGPDLATPQPRSRCVVRKHMGMDLAGSRCGDRLFFSETVSKQRNIRGIRR